jgi:hypothetical protein
MSELWKSGGASWNETLSGTIRAAEVATVEGMIAALDDLFVRADVTPDPDAYIDDEPLHWCAVEVASNLRAALFAAGGGFYSTALLATERAVQLAVAALAYRIQDSKLQVEGETTVKPAFTEWEGGASLPSTLDLGAWLDQRHDARPPLPPGVESPKLRYFSLVDELNAQRHHHHFQQGWLAPGFDERGYRLALDAMRDALDTIAGLWMLELPHLRARALPQGFGKTAWFQRVQATWAPA